MKNVLSIFSTGKRIRVILSLTAALVGWVLLQALPWSDWLGPYLMLKVLIAFVVFILPGICLAITFGMSESWFEVLADGFT